MTALLIGLLLFLGLHSTRMVAEGARSRFIAQRGERAWRGLYSLASAIGLVLIVWGFGQARQAPVVLWSPPDWTRPLASALTLVGIVLGVKVWAFAHLLTTRTLADLLLFGGFLLWAVWCFRSLRARDRAAGRQAVPGQLIPTVVAVVVGAAAWFVFGYWLHGWLIGVRPFG